MPLVINSLGSRHTHTHTMTIHAGSILRNQAHTGLQPVCTWFKNVTLMNSIASQCKQHLMKETGPSVGSFVGFHNHRLVAVLAVWWPSPSFGHHHHHNLAMCIHMHIAILCLIKVA